MVSFLRFCFIYFYFFLFSLAWFLLLTMSGFLLPCGWNSTVEVIESRVPFLAWPIWVDQYYFSKLVVSYLKMGYRVLKIYWKCIKRRILQKELRG